MATPEAIWPWAHSQAPLHQYSGSRWSRAGSRKFATIIPVHQTGLSRCRLCGEKVAKATCIAVEIVKAEPDQIGFTIQPRRWVVERFSAWINRNRRLAKDFEATIASAHAFLYAASVMILIRRLARST